ncbi:MAG: cytochrome P450 [Pseudomonadota bacterium]
MTTHSSLGGAGNGARQHKYHALTAPLGFDLASLESKQQPAQFFERIRLEGDIVPLKMPFVGKAWVTASYAASEAMLKDNALFVQEARHAGRSGVAGMTWWMPRSIKLLATNNMLLKDEPDHRRLRKLVDKAFQRRRVRDMRAEINAIADGLLDEAEMRGSFDLVKDYARPLPLEVICALLGLPVKNREVFSSWAKAATSMRSSLGILRAFVSMRGVVNYVREQIDECRRNPREGLITELVQAEEDGDRLSEDELVSMVFLLLFAGFETTTHLITDSVIALEQNPTQKAYLLANTEERIERATEELGRFTTPVQMTKPRYVSADCTFFGQRLKRGEIVLGLLAGANYDPAVFDDPGVLKLDRFPNPHLVFSSGVHFCLGMQLARVETQCALSRLYARHPGLRLADPNNLRWIKRMGLRGVSELPVLLNDEVSRKAA